MNLNWENLKYILIVSETGSASKAANVLGVKHATVIRKISQIENTLAAKIFHRTPTGMVATQLGLHVIESALKINYEAQKIAHQIKQQNDVANTVSLTFPPSFRHVLMQQVIIPFKQQNPNTQIVLAPDISYSKLSTFEHDIIIRICEDPPEDFIAVDLGKITYQAYAHKELDISPPFSWIFFGDNSLKLNDNNALDIFNQWSSDNYPGSKITLCSNDALTVQHAVQAQLGIGFLVKNLLSAQALEQLKEVTSIPSYERNIWLLLHPDHRQTQSIKRVFDLIKTQSPLFSH